MRCHYIFMLVTFQTEVWSKTEFKTWFKHKDKVTQCALNKLPTYLLM